MINCNNKQTEHLYNRIQSNTMTIRPLCTSAGCFENLHMKIAHQATSEADTPGSRDKRQADLFM